jgi:hypothetical protein
MTKLSVASCSAPVHSAKTISEDFYVPVVGVDVLRLVTRAVRGNEGVLAVWVDPVLDHVGAWYCHGWRNHRLALSCAVTGLPRGVVPPVPEAAVVLHEAVSAGSTSSEGFDTQALLSSTHGAAAALLLVRLIHVLPPPPYTSTSTPPLPHAFAHDS